MTTPLLEDYALFHKALAEPIRLRILALLNSRDFLCVCDLVSVLDISQSTVSRHLAYLKNKQLLNSWREGTWIHYAINENHTAYAILQTILIELATLDEIINDEQKLNTYEQTPRQC
ncbi:transcriptional regulator [Hydrogenovibrio sp. SC-1]|uniref:ArsR/SmtB family transcription factor n=1 Tax=Hydrogenovibrio sp. SC-1 TaxID=2065820 RepID=UPI000C7D99F8|nr:metalloregulator ArsR/SmtB family transcription factor [Hydrogenovibrio sp. SC-1]PLA75242.1 transcriptional regulator [Hydrogenovibrio sp. SC-1]